MKVLQGRTLERLLSEQRGLVRSMRELGFTDQLLHFRDLGRRGHVAFRRWTCQCGQHSVEIHDCSLGFTPKQRAALEAMVRCEKGAPGDPWSPPGSQSNSAADGDWGQS